jgi:cation:H+ antiporter
VPPVKRFSGDRALDLSTVITLGFGLALLIVGAEALVRGASRLAAALGVSPLLVGLTVVAFGTSSPELAVSVQSALSGSPDLALGNIVGSNIFNVLLILGLSAVIMPLVVAQRLVWFDIPIMIGASVLLFLFALDGQISRFEGVVLFAGSLAYFLFLFHQSRHEAPEVHREYEKEYRRPRYLSAGPWVSNVLLVVAGLALLVLGSRLLVTAAVGIARAVGISELIVGLTIVAASTSLPEAATSIIAGLRGERDIAVGNVVGSNILNILVVLGLATVVSPDGVAVSAPALAFDIPVMIGVAFATLPILFTQHLIARWEGALFLLYYAAYTLFLILDAAAHDAEPLFGGFMLAFVLPLTALTLLLLVVREVRARRTVA